MVRKMISGLSAPSSEPMSDASPWALKAARTAAGEAASAASGPGAAGDLADMLMPSHG
jgi:hypothetical protein